MSRAEQRIAIDWATDDLKSVAVALGGELARLGFALSPASAAGAISIRICMQADRVDFAAGCISPAHPWTLLEQALHCVPFNFAALPLLVEGESKEVRVLTRSVVVERLKPTVYSFTHNRYGVVEGTDLVRSYFSAEVFRRVHALYGAASPMSAFLALVRTEKGPLLVQRRVEDSNLEIRVKRFHVGSPVHRYLYTESQPTTQACGSLTRWSRFDHPVVCFDWRHPLHDTEGRRLADEPLSDDYAGIWVEDVARAKEVARCVFRWLEEFMLQADLVLVDMCMFIDRSGRMVFGEISPDCMRVREKKPNLQLAIPLDKDSWRTGESGDTVLTRYRVLHERLFGPMDPVEQA